MKNTYYILALALVVAFVGLGLWFGTPQPITSETFAGTLRRFASDPKTRTMLAMILIDVITGVMKALRLRTFDAKQLARFYGSNVVPYVLGYLLVWVLSLLGLDSVLSPDLQNGLASLGFAMIGTSLTASIIGNLTAINRGTPETA